MTTLFAMIPIIIIILYIVSFLYVHIGKNGVSIIGKLGIEPRRSLTQIKRPTTRLLPAHLSQIGLY